MICFTLRAMRASRLSPLLDGASVEFSATALLTQPMLPELCACCAAPATHRSALAKKAGPALLVGYCDACAEHQSSSAARVLALALSSLLLGLVAAAGLPLLFPWLGLLGLALAVFSIASLPLFALFLPRAAPCAQAIIALSAPVTSAGFGCVP